QIHTLSLHDALPISGNMVDIPVGTEATTYSFNIIAADYITLEHGDYERRCDPIDRVYGDNTGAYWYMACSTSNASVENQIELERSEEHMSELQSREK